MPQSPGVRCALTILRSPIRHAKRITSRLHRLNWLLAVAIATLAFQQTGRGVTLEWDPNQESDIAGYRLYYGTSSGNYSNTIEVGNETTALVEQLDPAGTYYFAVTAYNTEGLESLPSDEVSYTAPSGIPNGVYRILARHSAKVLTAAGGGTGNGTNVEQRTYTGASNQHWTVSQSNGEYSIVGVPSGRAIDIYGVSTADGANACLWDNWGGANQRYTLTATTNGYYRISPNHSGKALDVYGASTAEGANVLQWGYTGGYNQQWRLDPISLTGARLQSHNFPTRYLRHSWFQARIDENVAPEDDSRFDIVPGINGVGGVSFRSANYPTHYLTVRADGTVWLDADDGTNDFRNNATFVRVAGLADPAKSSFQMWNDSTRYLRHYGFVIHATTIPDQVAQADATFAEVP